MPVTVGNPPELLTVGLCGRAAAVPLRSDDGLKPFQSRVAGTFGLTAPFELVDSEGLPLRSDADVGRVVEAAAASSAVDAAHSYAQVTIDTTEDALLDLERAHAESGELRWALLRKLITGLRRQIADVATGIGESRQHAARLDEQLVAEQTRREVADSSLQRELRLLATNLDDGLERSSRQARAALEEAVASVESRTDASLKAEARTQLARTEAVQEELRAVEAARLRANDDFSRSSAELRSILDLERRGREEAVAVAMQSVQALEARLTAEREERQQDVTKALKCLDAVRDEVAHERKGQESLSLELQRSIEELQSALRNEVASRTQATDVLVSRLTAVAEHAESKLLAHCNALETSLRDEILSKETETRASISLEKAARDKEESCIRETIEAVVADLKAEIIERQSGDNRNFQAGQCIVNEAIEREHLRVNDALEDTRKTLEALFQGMLGVEERTRASEIAVLHGEFGELREALATEKQARESACNALQSAELKNQEELRQWRAAQDENSREWARLLVERLSSDVRTERNAALGDLRHDFSGIVQASANQLRTELLDEVRRLDSKAEDIVKQHTKSRMEDRAEFEFKVQAGAQDVKSTLAAQVDFAEALEREQRLVVERFSQSIAREASQREDLAQRISATESDMHKVRRHLSCIFA